MRTNQQSTRSVDRPPCLLHNLNKAFDWLPLTVAFISYLLSKYLVMIIRWQSKLSSSTDFTARPGNVTPSPESRACSNSLHMQVPTLQAAACGHPWSVAALAILFLLTQYYSYYGVLPYYY